MHGVTGSIGRQTLAVIDLHPERFRVDAISAGRDLRGLAEICARYQPRWAVIADPALYQEAVREIAVGAPNTQLLAGPQSLCELAAHAEIDVVVAAIVGAAGLPSTMAAAQAGKTLLLANKEALVMAGDLVMAAARASGATLLPIDSEHNGLFQCLPNGEADPAHGVDRLWLTASGGPFLRWSAEQIAAATVEQAVAHPNWQMGRKISVDSATLMNKGLEVIEAQRLFDVGPERIGVLVHPQSIVHALVEYGDGSFLAHLGAPDMRTPIAHALGWPDRIASGARHLDPLSLSQLQFEAPDHARFPCLDLAYQALRAGGSAPIALNAANEMAVEAFLNGVIGFTQISALVEETLRLMPVSSPGDLESVLALDQQARRLAGESLGAFSSL
ncbi:MAG: 1-deoxy-D-xylulose-5-phosphate reductoisomerase [Xanthomonadales bacterium]|nr:1-deoxy-D-xylulose-5-phosphate reductoisomerase [Xanthomonadales bacterium]